MYEGRAYECGAGVEFQLYSAPFFGAVYTSHDSFISVVGLHFVLVSAV